MAMLYIIGLGLNDEKDISVKGKEIVAKADMVYLEDYTSILSVDKESLEKFLGKEIIALGRSGVEEDSVKLIQEARDKNVCLLVVGDPFSATTHIELFKEANLKGIGCNIINGASVLTAVGITGLQLYKFGRTTSIPFPKLNPDVETPYGVIKENQSHGLHTLLLLDLNPKENKFMTVNDAIVFLLKLEEKKKQDVFTKDTPCVGCARLGGDHTIIYGKAKELKEKDFGKAPYCLIIPGELHFGEKEVLDLWKEK